MKRFILLLSFFIAANIVLAQCTAPVVDSWYFSTPSNVEVVFDVPDAAQVYELKVYALYTASGPVPGTANTTFTGTAAQGINSISVNPAVILDFTVTAPRYFYKAELRVECGDDEWSEATSFYMSPYSMLNNPGITCEGFFSEPMMMLPDDGFTGLEYEFEVPAGEGPESISEIGVLVDIGHTYNGDLSISLISPAGTEVFLLDHPNNLANTSGLSMYFSDLGQSQSIDNQYGIFDPVGSLSAFEGEPSEGIWTLSVIDNSQNDYGFLFGVCLNFGPAPCAASVNGITYYDLNSNNVKDAAEPVFPFAHLYDTENGVDFYSDMNGEFYYCFSQGNNVIEVLNVPDYYTVSPQSVPLNLPLGGFSQGVNFGVAPEPGFKDLQLTMWQAEPVIAGASAELIVEYKNIGTSCISGADLLVTLADGLSISGIDMDNVTILNPTTAEISVVSDICPNEPVLFTISCNADAGLALGTVLESQVSISQLAPNEQNEPLENNTFVLESEVRDEVILNFKSVSHDTITSWFMSQDQRLHYLIHFQNSGTEPLQNLVVQDEIDPLLDLSTFTIEGVSHSMVIEQEDNLISFIFNDIDLPAAELDEFLSRGYIRYSIKPETTMAPGDIIDNTASLFLDDESAINLNLVTTTLIESTGLEEISFDAKLFPNPASNNLQISWPESVIINTISVYGIDGKLIDAFAVNASSQLNIDVSDFSTGVYLLRFESSSTVNPVIWMKD